MYSLNLRSVSISCEPLNIPIKFGAGRGEGWMAGEKLQRSKNRLYRRQ